MRIWGLIGGSTVLGLVVVSGVQAATQPKSLPNLQDTFPGCKWEEVRGKELSVWSCNTKALRLTADDTLSGFVLEDGAAGSKSPVIRIFKKPADAPLKSVLAQVRKASPGKYTARCALVPAPELKGKRFTLSPTGALEKAWQASQKDATMEDEPCGPLGEGYAGDRYFEATPGDPTTVVFVDMGSEIQIFDPDTLTP